MDNKKAIYELKLHTGEIKYFNKKRDKHHYMRCQKALERYYALASGITNKKT